MYWPIPGIKKYPERRWRQPDRIFFGFGACHILTGAFLEERPFEGFYGEWIIPNEGFSGTHMYVTNGLILFDYHGYVLGQKLFARYWKGHQDCYCGWQANIEKIEFPLLDTTALNKRKHLGPDQSFGDPAPAPETSSNRRSCLPSYAIPFEIGRVRLRPQLALFLGRLWFAVSINPAVDQAASFASASAF